MPCGVCAGLWSETGLRSSAKCSRRDVGARLRTMLAPLGYRFYHLTAKVRWSAGRSWPIPSG